MKKSIQRLMGVAFCICVLVYGLAHPITSYAEESDMRIESRMTYISSYETKLSISDSGSASVFGQVKGKK